MSPTQRSTVSDQQSEKRSSRGRPPAATPAELLDAAGTVFDTAAGGDAGSTSMDAVAAAAGVGKATLFRTFGDRDGLLDALSSARFAQVRAAVSDGAAPFEPDRPAVERAVAFLDAVLDFKLRNANVLRAREERGPADLRSERYRWTHAFLRDLLALSAPQAGAGDASLVAHGLLAVLRIDLLDELVDQGHSIDDVRRLQRERVQDFAADR